MPRPSPNRVSITLRPEPGNEPDAFVVTFQAADGSETSGLDLDLPAGKVGTWEITATVAVTVSPGGGFLFQRHTFLFSHRIQDYNPLGRDFVTLETETDAGLATAGGVFALTPIAACRLTGRIRHLLQPPVDGMVQRTFRVVAVAVGFTGGHASEYFNTLLNGLHGVDMEPAVLHSLDHIVTQHQVLDVVSRDNHTLLTG